MTARRRARQGSSRGRGKRRRRTAARAAVRRTWVRLRRIWLRLQRAPPAARLLVALLVLATVAFAINGLYQVLRKPTELFFPVSGELGKTPEDTWRAYESAFRRYATPSVTPELLAALAQVEGSGNPLVRTYWRWSWSARPFDLYRPASSAVGMYQITDGTFAEARHYCIHHHTLTREGPWNDWHACWFNSLYMRVVPRDAVELTAAYLDLKVNGILAELPHAAPTALERQHLAAVVHLCGAGAAALYARHGFRFAAGQRCGDHDPREYVRRVDQMRAEFMRIAAHSDLQ